MVSWSVVAAALIAVGAGTRWWVRGPDALGRPRRYPVVLSVLMAVVTTVSVGAVYRHLSLESDLAEAAGALIGSEVEVECQGLGSWFVDLGSELGYVRWGPDGVPERRTLIKRDVCGDLRAFVSAGGKNATSDQRIAVHVLTHEAMHMAGEKSEAVTECQAVQRNAELARLLGASAEDAAALSTWYWRSIYPVMPTEYRSGDCGPGRAWDEGLPSPPWSA